MSTRPPLVLGPIPRSPSFLASERGGFDLNRVVFSTLAPYPELSHLEPLAIQQVAENDQATFERNIINGQLGTWYIFLLVHGLWLCQITGGFAEPPNSKLICQVNIGSHGFRSKPIVVAQANPKIAGTYGMFIPSNYDIMLCVYIYIYEHIYIYYIYIIHIYIYIYIHSRC